MNNDELQKAIDDITSGDTNAPVMPVPVNDDAADENDQLANEFGGTATPTMTAAEQVAAELGEEPVKPAETLTAAEPVAPVAPEVVSEVPKMSVEPVMPKLAAVEPIVPEAPVVPEEPIVPNVPEVPEMPVTPVEEPAIVGMDEVAGSDLEEVKKNALKELYPLLKNMNINPEQAFDICKQVAEMGEKGAIKEAFEAAKKISDDQTRANALFEIVEMIDE